MHHHQQIGPFPCNQHRVALLSSMDRGHLVWTPPRSKSVTVLSFWRFCVIRFWRNGVTVFVYEVFVSYNVWFNLTFRSFSEWLKPSQLVFLLGRLLHVRGTILIHFFYSFNIGALDWYSINNFSYHYCMPVSPYGLFNLVFLDWCAKRYDHIVCCIL